MFHSLLNKAEEFSVNELLIITANSNTKAKIIVIVVENPNNNFRASYVRQNNYMCRMKQVARSTT